MKKDLKKEFYKPEFKKLQKTILVKDQKIQERILKKWTITKNTNQFLKSNMFVQNPYQGRYIET